MPSASTNRATATAPLQFPAMTEGTNLVERVGGRAEMRRILARFYAALAADPMVAHHFAGRDLDEIIDGQLAFLCKAFGETKEFSGRHPSVAHDELAPILRGQFDRRLVLLEETLVAEGVSETDRAQWLGIERSMRSVVQKK